MLVLLLLLLTQHRAQQHPERHHCCVLCCGRSQGSCLGAASCGGATGDLAGPQCLWCVAAQVAGGVQHRQVPEGLLLLLQQLPQGQHLPLLLLLVVAGARDLPLPQRLLP